MRLSHNIQMLAVMRPIKTFFLIFIIIAAALLPGCYFLPKEEEVLAPPIKEPQKITYDTIEVKKGTIERVINCTGNFVSVSQQDLYLKNNGARLKAVHVKLGDKVKKGDLIAEMETGSLETEIEFQQIALRKAQIAYRKLELQLADKGVNKDSYSEIARLDLELAKLDVDASRLRLDKLQEELQKTKIISPIDGEVVYIKNISQGEYLNTYDTLVRIADPKVLQLQYSGGNVLDFPLGARVTVSINSKEYEGEVVATPAQAPLNADETTKKSIRIAVDNLPPDLAIGDPASITMTLEKKENVIILPKQVVNSFVNRRFVNVLKDGIREERDVEIGMQTATEVEVVKGLEVGELVIVR